MQKTKIIIDTDPGHDDALALLMTFLSKKFDVLAVTTVAGNADIERVTRNAQSILDLIGAKTKIFSGEAKPLKRELVTAVVHGKSGLAGFDTSRTAYQLSNNAAEKIVELVNQFPGEITILALGPLTNIAKALQLDSSLGEKIKQLVIMGGAINVPGNKNRVAEFNFFVDPEAAALTMSSKIDKVLVPLDACNGVVLQVEDFRSLAVNKLKKILIPMMQHFVEALRDDEGVSGILVYDALAAYFLLNQEAFILKEMDLLVETKGEHTFGMTVAEKRAHKIQDKNVKVVLEVDASIFKKDFFKILSKAS